MSKDQKRKFFWCRLLLYYINMLNGVGAPTPPPSYQQTNRGFPVRFGSLTRADGTEGGTT